MAGESVARRRSPLALVLLVLLAEEPMHPYRMQRLMKQRGKDQIANVAQRNSVYQTIDRLLRGGLIAVRETGRDEGRPERTVYELTEEGRTTVASWLRTMLSTPAREFPEFPAALASAALLGPVDLLAQLTIRADHLAETLAAPVPEIALPRLFMLDDEYKRVMMRAELDWTRSVLDELRSGELTWDAAWVREIAEANEPSE